MKEQPPQKTVYIIYGKNEVKKKRVMERLIENKRLHEFKEQDLDESCRLIFSNSNANIFYIKCSDIVAFEPLISESERGPNFKAHFFSKDATGNLSEISDPQLIIENTSFNADDVAYFSKMDHVALVPCL